MVSVEISIGHSWKQDVRYLHELLPYRPADASLNLSEIRDIVDIVIDGTNLTSNVAEESIFGLISELLEALVNLLESKAQKVIIEFPSEPWELVLVPYGRRLLVSLYSLDRCHRVMAQNVPIDGATFTDAVTRVAESMLTDLFRISEKFSIDPFVRKFSSYLGQLKRSKYIFFPVPSFDAPGCTGTRAGSTTGTDGLTLSYQFDGASQSLSQYRGEHAFDLHALLFPGHIEVEHNGELITLTDTFPYLSIQSLMHRVRYMLHLLESGDEPSLFRLDDPMYHGQLDVFAQGPRWQLRAYSSDSPDQYLECTLPPGDCIDGLLTLAELFIHDLINLHPHLELNQRFSDLQEEVTFLRGWHRDLSANNIYLDEPESYLRELGHINALSVPALAPPNIRWSLSETRALFPRVLWQADAQEIDFSTLTATPDGVILSTDQALRCVDLTTGRENWSYHYESVDPKPSFCIAGDFVVLAHSISKIELLDRRTGDVAASYQSTLRWSHIIRAAHYDSEHIVVIADLHGHILALSSLDGEKQWEYSTGVGRFAGVGFSGPLLSTLTSEGFVSTLNPLNGETLWKVRLGGLAEVPPLFHQGRLYLLTHDIHLQSTAIHAFYPFTGRTVWQMRIDGVVAGPPSFVGNWLLLPVERRGQIILEAIPIESIHPQPSWQIELSSAGLYQPTPVTIVEIDGEAHGLVKTDRAELTCFRLRDGAILWRTMPETEMLLLYGNLPLLPVRDAIISINASIDFRAIDSGKLLHRFYPTEAPEFLCAFGELYILIGEQGAHCEDSDTLTALSLKHYLAVVK